MERLIPRRSRSYPANTTLREPGHIVLRSSFRSLLPTAQRLARSSRSAEEFSRLGHVCKRGFGQALLDALVEIHYPFPAWRRACEQPLDVEVYLIAGWGASAMLYVDAINFDLRLLSAVTGGVGGLDHHIVFAHMGGELDFTAHNLQPSGGRPKATMRLMMDPVARMPSKNWVDLLMSGPCAYTFIGY